MSTQIDITYEKIGDREFKKIIKKTSITEETYFLSDVIKTKESLLAEKVLFNEDKIREIQADIDNATLFGVSEVQEIILE